VDLVGVAGLAPGKPVTMVVHKKSGAKVEVPLEHTFNAEQIEWFKAGSALNFMKKKISGA